MSLQCFTRMNTGKRQPHSRLSLALMNAHRSAVLMLAQKTCENKGEHGGQLCLNGCAEDLDEHGYAQGSQGGRA